MQLSTATAWFRGASEGCASSEGRRRAGWLAAGAVTVFCMIAMLAAAAQAATITVDSLSDTSSLGTCTLRDAISTAQGSPVTGSDCTSTADTTNFIVFKSGLTGIITLGHMLPTIMNGTTLTITGPNISPGITIDGNAAVGAMKVDSGATLNLTNLTVAHANSGADGGGVYNAGTLTVTNITFFEDDAGGGGAIANEGGTLTVTDSTFYANIAAGSLGGAIYSSGPTTVNNTTFSYNLAAGSNPAGGGGIYSNGPLTVTNSTFSGNLAPGTAGNGGGIYSNGPTIVNNTTFSHNRAGTPHLLQGSGGGIYNYGGPLTVTNSTFSGNSAPGDYGFGGGIESGGTLTLTNSTFSGNSANGLYGGGGDLDNFGDASIKGTIFAGRSRGGNCSGDTITDDGFNVSGDGTCASGGEGSLNNVTKGELNLDPRGLRDNGGPTRTIALLAGSVAIDEIPYTSCTYPVGSLNPCSTTPSNHELTCDQRGMPRAGPNPNSYCDIGAYEYQVTSAFAGQPSTANCYGESVSALVRQYGSLRAAAAVLGYSSVKELNAAMRNFCG
jgi:predicted outer membrane repeat protein